MKVVKIMAGQCCKIFGTSIIDFVGFIPNSRKTSSLTIQDFEDIINEQYDESKLKNGYAPFCKHLFIPNTSSDVRVNVLQITADNEHLIRTKYEARTELEVRIKIFFLSIPSCHLLVS